MQIWIDSVDTQTIEIAKEFNFIYGITTNPTILSKSPLKPRQTIDKLLALQPGKLAIQVVRHDCRGIIEQARRLSHYSNRIIVKIPVTLDGMKAMAILKKENIPFLATTVLELNQLYLAATLGAIYAAPYVGSIEKAHGSYQPHLTKMFNTLRQQNFPTKLMAAGLTSLDEVLFCAELGVHAVTLPAKVFADFITTTALVDSFLDKFDQAWGDREDELFRVDERIMA